MAAKLDQLAIEQRGPRSSDKLDDPMIHQ